MLSLTATVIPTIIAHIRYRFGFANLTYIVSCLIRIDVA